MKERVITSSMVGVLVVNVSRAASFVLMGPNQVGRTMGIMKMFLGLMMMLGLGASAQAGVLIKHTWHDNVTAPTESTADAIVHDISGNGNDGWLWFATADNGTLDLRYYSYSVAILDPPGSAPTFDGNRWGHSGLLDNRTFAYWKFENVVRESSTGYLASGNRGYSAGYPSIESWAFYVHSGTQSMCMDFTDSAGNWLWNDPEDPAQRLAFPIGESHTWEFFYDGDGGPGGGPLIGMRRDGGSWITKGIYSGPGTSGTINPTTAPMLIGSYWTNSGIEESAHLNATLGAVTIADAAPIGVTGRIIPADYSGDLRNIVLKVEFRQGGTPVQTSWEVLDADGRFTVNVMPGTYNVALKGSCWLQNVIPSVVIPAQPPTQGYDLGAIPLTGGDINGDNSIGTSDLSIWVVNCDQVGDE